MVNTFLLRQLIKSYFSGVQQLEILLIFSLSN